MDNRESRQETVLILFSEWAVLHFCEDQISTLINLKISQTYNDDTSLFECLYVCVYV